MYGKVHPILAAFTPCRTVEKAIFTRTDLIKQGNVIALHSSLLRHIKIELAVQVFELVVSFIHVSALFQFCPTVKNVVCDLFGSRFVGLWSAQGIIAELLNEDGVYGADKNT